MRKNLLKTMIVLSIGLLTYETTFSLPQIILNKADDFSIEIGTVSKSTFSSCGNSIANCLVTLKLMIHNEGFVIIHNNSSRTLTNVRAYFRKNYKIRLIKMPLHVFHWLRAYPVG